MEDFGKWLARQGQDNKSDQHKEKDDVATDTPDIPERYKNLSEDDQGIIMDLADFNDYEWDDTADWYYPCRSCGRDFPLQCEPEEFDPNFHYCGRNKHCCP